MESPRRVVLDATEAVASVAYRASEVIAIYPITPSSTMGELADEWAAHGPAEPLGRRARGRSRCSPRAAPPGAVHGALQAGALATTFTASQGLLLMIPNMYKIAGELTPFVHPRRGARARHARALDLRRPLRRHGLPADRLRACCASGSVQEAHDLALIAHAATLASRVPFLHFFDGFRTSHEVAKIERARRRRPARADRRRRSSPRTAAARSRPTSPVLRGTAQNPDIFFQAREAVQPLLRRVPGVVQDAMDRFAARTGRALPPLRLRRAPEAERVIVLMGSGAETAHETVDWLRRARREGRRPQGAALPARSPSRPSSRALPRDGARDRGARPHEGAGRGRRAALPGRRHRARARRATSARRSSRESSAGATACLEGVHAGDGEAVFDELRERDARATTSRSASSTTSRTRRCPSTRTSTSSRDDVVRAVFYGLGADGTVGANKNSIKIIGEETDATRRATSSTTRRSRARSRSRTCASARGPIRSAYLIRRRASSPATSSRSSSARRAASTPRRARCSC